MIFRSVSQFVDGENSLVITDITTDHQAAYTCIAVNVAGNLQQTY